MKPKTIILMVIAIVCGLGASFMTSRLLAEREEEKPQVAEVPKEKILVARKNLANQVRINKPEELFVEKWVSKEDKPAGAVDDYKALKGKFLKNNLRANDHVTGEDLVDVGTRLPVPLGMVGIGVRVTI